MHGEGYVTAPPQRARRRNECAAAAGRHTLGDPHTRIGVFQLANQAGSGLEWSLQLGFREFVVFLAVFWLFD
jgi:hypothetical protein